MLISRQNLKIKVKRIIVDSQSTKEAVEKINNLIKDSSFVTLSAIELFHLYEHD